MALVAAGSVLVDPTLLLGPFVVKDLFQRLAHLMYTILRRIELVAVAEHQPHVGLELLSVLILVVVQGCLDRAQIHRFLDDIVVLWDVESYRIHWQEERIGHAGVGTALQVVERLLAELQLGCKLLLPWLAR